MMMKKIMASVALAGLIPLAACNTTTGGGVDPDVIAAFVSTVQADARALCGFYPLASGIVSILSGGVAGDAGAVAALICAGTPTTAVAHNGARGSARIVHYNGHTFVIRGR